MKKTISPLLFFVILVFGISVEGGSLEVIADTGDTLSITPYIKRSDYVEVKPTRRLLPLSSESLHKFPVHTPSMEPGVFESRVINIPHFQTPLFIIGNDDLSKEWLSTNIGKFKKI